mmetsp:Transcript_18021/g.54172  ORF Transcript_18021/g.54172 Transcript_18021/m.54172 type:complete len:269 (+) Transcript_18021:612-1418(+)
MQTPWPKIGGLFNLIIYLSALLCVSKLTLTHIVALCSQCVVFGCQFSFHGRHRFLSSLVPQFRGTRPIGFQSCTAILEKRSQRSFDLERCLGYSPTVGLLFGIWGCGLQESHVPVQCLLQLGRLIELCILCTMKTGVIVSTLCRQFQIFVCEVAVFTVRVLHVITWHVCKHRCHRKLCARMTQMCGLLIVEPGTCEAGRCNLLDVFGFTVKGVIETRNSTLFVECGKSKMDCSLVGHRDRNQIWERQHNEVAHRLRSKLDILAWTRSL